MAKKKPLYLDFNKKTHEPLDFRPKEQSNIYAIICKPISEKYYSVSINDLNNSEMVERTNIPEYIATLAPKIVNVNSLSCSFKSFIIMVEENTCEELDTIIEETKFKMEDYKIIEEKPSLLNQIQNKMNSLEKKVLY